MNLLRALCLTKWLLFFGALAAFPKSLAETTENASDDAIPDTCSWEDRENCQGGAYRDPNLVPTTFQVDDHQETLDVYVMPDVATFYNATPGAKKKMETTFRGQFGKFINLSPESVRVYWQSRGADPLYIADLSPFGSAGTATYPGHQFVVTDRNDVSRVLQEWTIEGTSSLYYYDPFGSLEEAEKALKAEEFELYKLQHRSLTFSKVYHRKTGRQWLALYGRKHAPQFSLWPAKAFGQTHTVTTKETHFLTQPPDQLSQQAVSSRGPTAMDLEIKEKLKPYRSPEDSLTLNMTVISVAPRAFEIKNFLSNEEVTHLLELATGMTLSRSTTRAGDAAEATTNDSTRTSQNSWISRHRTAIVDSIYRRAADLLQIDEACFRFRTDEEQHLIPNSTDPVTERLQLVHYDVGQQYTPHHDFAVPDLRDGQPSRFATLLFYLNEGMEGGETSFPRWLNSHTREILKVTPEVGKAILFYNVLPDGNYDERSQHAALPVTKGEKWLTNLWVWDPYMA